MNEHILSTGVQNFIKDNVNTDIVSVLLKKPLFDGVSNQELAQQLEARRKCEKKLPTWFAGTKIYYPDKLNIEQTSSEITAHYKSRIIHGKSLADLSGGLGVDSYFFSHNFEQVVHCEIDNELSQIAAYNFGILGAKNISTLSVNGMDFLKDSTTNFNWLYLDPSRRNDDKGKVFRLSDCRPNVLDTLDVLFTRSDNILLKTSPMLDISMGIGELRHVEQIHIVAVNNEVKELLWILRKEYSGDSTIKTINLLKTGRETFDFQLSEEKTTVAQCSLPLSYIYEPNAAILKSGAFKLLGNRLVLKKLQEHTHLYTSDTLLNFPGRRFKVDEAIPYAKKAVKELGLFKANISTRNFPESVADLRKRFKIGDGGDSYLFFTTDLNHNKTVLRCSKI